MKAKITICAVAVFCAFVAVPASATLTVIGTATYDGTDYDLIWDDDNGGGQDVVYLDYDYSHDKWLNHPDAIAWANTLDAALTINLLPGFSVTWSGSWRLPAVSGSIELGNLDTEENPANPPMTSWPTPPSYKRFWVGMSATGQIYQQVGAILQHDNPNDYDNGAIAVRSVSEVIITEVVPTIKFESAASGDLESVTPAELTVLLVSPEEGQTYTVDYAAVGGTATAGEDYTIAGGGPACWRHRTQCHGDTDNDGEIKGSDFLALKASWYKCDPDPDYDPSADFDRDGCVKASDFLILKSNWYKAIEANCPPEGGSATLEFAPGETSKTIDIDIIDDGLAEEDETIIVELSNPTGLNVGLGEPNQHVYTIEDPRMAVGFEVDSSSDWENVSPIEITVNLAVAATKTVTVDYAATGGTATGGGVDYTLADGTLTFDPGETSKTISIAVVDDGIAEDNETIVITLSNPVNAKLGAITEYTYTIVDPSQLHLKVDLGLPMCGSTPDSITTMPGTVKEGWWGRVFWGDVDMYMHDFAWEDGSRGFDPPDTPGVDGSGVHFALDNGRAGNGGYHVHGMCRCNLAGDCCPTGSPSGEPIANGWWHNIDWGGECRGDIHMRITGLPAGEYELKSYHNHWEPCSQSTRNCLNCNSQMPPMTSVRARSLGAADDGCSSIWAGAGTGTGVTSIVEASNIDVTSVLSDDNVATSTIEFETDGSDVLVVYEGGDNSYPDPARTGREGHKGILNAFELKSIGP